MSCDTYHRHVRNGKGELLPNTASGPIFRILNSIVLQWHSFLGPHKIVNEYKYSSCIWDLPVESHSPTSEEFELIMDTPALQSLLRSNEPPDAIAKSQVLHSIQTLDELLATTSARKTQLLTALAAIIEEEEELTANKKSLKAILSSVRVIPPELVSIVVGFAFDGLRPFELLEYARVSRVWREAILRTPRLWTTLSLTINVTNVNATQVIDGIKAWIGRSGVLPLSISLEGMVSNITCAQSLMLSLPEKHRCTSLILGPRFVDALVDGNSPAVFANLGPLTTLPVPLEQSPESQLKALSLRCYRSLSGNNFFAPWSCLRSLDLECPSSTFDYLTIVMQCTNIEECSLTFHTLNARMDSSYSIDNEQNIGAISLRRLRKLQLLDFRSTGGILPYLNLPKLHELDLRAASRYSGDNVNFFPQDTVMDVADLIKRSRCRLEKLNCRELEIDEESSLPILLPYLNFVVELSVGHSFVAFPSILDAVADGQSLPALKTLRLVVPHDTITPYTFHNSVNFHPRLEEARLDCEDGHNWRMPTSNIIWRRRDSAIEED